MKLRLMICAAAASTALFAGDNDATSATYAVMNVPNANTDTVIAVPWVGLDGSAIKISDLVNTTTLSAGDKLYMYGTDGKWYASTKNAEGQWDGSITVSGAGTLMVASQTVDRGTALLLQRASEGGNVFLCGRVGDDTITTTIASGKTLFANPTASAVNLNDKFTAAAGATKGDAIMIPLNNGGSDTYTFNGAEWGKFTKVEDGTVTVAGQTFTRYKEQWQRGGTIPAGTGAWYTTTGAGYTVTW